MRYRLRGARIWDGIAPTVSEAAVDVYLDGGEIASVGGVVGGSARSSRKGDDADSGGEGWRDVALPPGSVIAPGMIDAHVHLDLDPGLMNPESQFEASREDRDLRMIARAEAMVRAGITTARDLGAGEWRELALRDAIAEGLLPGPRLVCAGQPLTIAEGHCHFWGGVAAGPEEQAQVIQRQLDRGVDWVKVMATGGYFTKGSGVDRAQFTESELRTVVEISEQAGRRVAAHCHGKLGIQNAARSGVWTIEHCSFASSKGYGADYAPEVVADVAASGAWVSPTVNANWLRRMEKDGQPSTFFRNMTEVLAGLRAAGIPLLASTDAGIPGVLHHRLSAGLMAFARYGAMSPVEVLRSATSDSARALGLDKVCGRIEAGLSADLMVLAGDPLENLSLLEHPLFVVARGRIVENIDTLPAEEARA